MVNTDKGICRMIAAILAGYGVKDVVVSPGSRNTPLVMAVCRNSTFNIHQVVDERSAAFIAVGMASVSNLPVAVICTSGSAVLDFAPAVAEAYYRNIPLIVISADRPVAWIDQLDSQTIRQNGILYNITVACCDLDDECEDDLYQNRLLNDTLVKALYGRRGPVHINVHLSAPLSCETSWDAVGEYHRLIEYVESPQVISTSQSRHFAEELRGKKVLVVGGFHKPDARLGKALGELAALPQVAVVTEGVANIHATGIFNTPSAILSGITSETRKRLEPDVVISFGGSLVSSELKEYLRSCDAAQNWCVGRNETTIDCFRTLTRRIEVEPAGFFPRLAGAMTYMNRRQPVPSGYSAMWHTVASEACVSSENFINSAPWSDLAVAGHIIDRIPPSANLQLGNGMSVRYASLHDLGTFHRVDSNRGVSGIDGCIATAIGASYKYNGLTYAIIGDMSATYDMGALAYSAMSPRLRLIVINNGGGGIFHFVKTTRELPEKSLMVNSPRPPLKELSEAYGLRYFSADNFVSLSDALTTMSDKEGGAAVLEVFTNGELSAEIAREYFSRNKTTI